MSCVELKCETDFVAKGDKFQAVANALAAHVAETSPADIEALLASEIEPGKTVQAFVDEANANLGEKIVLDRFAQFTGGYVTAYMHRTMPDLPPQIGVLVELDKAERRASPRASRSTSPPSPRSTSPARTSRPRSSSPSAASPRRPPAPRASPRPRCRRSSRVASTASSRRPRLLGQPYALDNKKSVQKVLDEAGVTLKRFSRIKVGI